MVNQKQRIIATLFRTKLTPLICCYMYHIITLPLLLEIQLEISQQSQEGCEWTDDRPALFRHNNGLINSQFCFIHQICDPTCSCSMSARKAMDEHTASIRHVLVYEVEYRKKSTQCSFSLRPCLDDSKTSGVETKVGNAWIILEVILAVLILAVDYTSDAPFVQSLSIARCNVVAHIHYPTAFRWMAPNCI